MVVSRSVREHPRQRVRGPILGRWPLLPARTNATTQAAGAMRALERATLTYEHHERTAAGDDLTLLYADEVIRCRLRLYGLLARLGMRPAAERNAQLWRDAELLRYTSIGAQPRAWVSERREAS